MELRRTKAHEDVPVIYAYRPAGLMFVDRPRIEIEGCRWIPTGFLAGDINSTLPDSWDSEGAASIGRPTVSGLLVTLPGSCYRT